MKKMSLLWLLGLLYACDSEEEVYLNVEIYTKEGELHSYLDPSKNKAQFIDFAIYDRDREALSDWSTQPIAEKNAIVKVPGWGNKQLFVAGRSEEGAVFWGASVPFQWPEDFKKKLRISIGRPNHIESNAGYQTPGDLSEFRFGASITSLPDGRVLVAGGYCQNDRPCNTMELFEPQTNDFRTLSVTLDVARAAHSATLLDDQTILFVGGTETPSKQAALLQLKDWSWKSIDFNGDTLFEHQAVSLPDGSVLLAGGLKSLLSNDGQAAYSTGVYRYLPESKSFETVAIGGQGDAVSGEGDSEGSFSRKQFTLLKLSDGAVAIGGVNQSNTPLKSCVLFQLNQGSLQTNWVENCLNSGRYAHAAVEDLEGDIVVIGGYKDGDRHEVGDFERLSIQGNALVNKGVQSLVNVGGELTADLLFDGSILLLGGRSAAGESKNAMRIMPQKEGEDSQHVENVHMGLYRSRYGHSTVRLPNYNLLILNGFHNLKPSKLVEQYFPEVRELIDCANNRCLKDFDERSER